MCKNFYFIVYNRNPLSPTHSLTLKFFFATVFLYSVSVLSFLVSSHLPFYISISFSVTHFPFLSSISFTSFIPVSLLFIGSGSYSLLILSLYLSFYLSLTFLLFSVFPISLAFAYYWLYLSSLLLSHSPSCISFSSLSMYLFLFYSLSIPVFKLFCALTSVSSLTLSFFSYYLSHFSLFLFISSPLNHLPFVYSISFTLSYQCLSLNSL